MATNGQLLAKIARGETLLESEIIQLERAMNEAEAATKVVQGWQSGNGARADMVFQNARFLSSPSKSATFTRTTAASIADNTATYVTFEAAYGSGAFKLDPTDATRIIADWGGNQILISGAAEWATNANGYRATQIELYNGSGSLITSHTLQVEPPVAADVTRNPFVVVMNSYLYKNLSYVKVVVRKTGGGSLNLNSLFITFSLI